VLSKVFASVFIFLAWFGALRAERLELYINADYSISAAAAQSIELGIRTALEEVDFLLGGQEVALTPMDNRGNVKRSHRTMGKFLESDTALAMFGGLNSPPFLTHREFLNENRVLTLLPWSAAGPITRSTGSENWIFRLSVDDSLSGSFFVQKAVEQGGCKRVALVLLDTGWGRANFKTLTTALAARGMSPVTTQYFPSSISSGTADALAQKVSWSNPDCAIMLSAWTNGALVVNALSQHMPTLRLFSHWGIMGGEFTDRVPHRVRDKMQLSVLQTCALRREGEGNAILSEALERAAPGISSISELPAPTGFVHGYDLTRILIAAAAQAAKSPDWSGSIQDRRAALHAALENLETPVMGILKEYAPPFRPGMTDPAFGHEALGAQDLCLATFQPNGLLAHAR
jgi:branched-chain amino acid transport system substrate-binding protein